MFSLHPSLYFFLQFLFQLFLMSILVPDENSMNDPLCDSSFGSMVTLDYVTPITKEAKAAAKAASKQQTQQQRSKGSSRAKKAAVKAAAHQPKQQKLQESC